MKRGKHFSIVVVSEGAKPLGGQVVIRQKVAGSPEAIRLGGISAVLSQQIEQCTGIETRYTILGHLQRGGTPSPFDRYLATEFATSAVELLSKGRFNRMVCIQQGRLNNVPLSVPGKEPRGSAGR